jgi:predicted RND superfamily exporter protein
MTPPVPGRLEGIFARARWPFVAIYALLLVPSAHFALQVGQDNSIDRLIVPGDPAVVATQQFQKIFGAGEFALLLVEADDPYAPAVLARVDAVERAIAKVPDVAASSALSIFLRAHPGFRATPEDAAAFRRFATGTDLLREQGLVGRGFLAIGLSLAVQGPAQRSQVLGAVDAAIAAANPAPSPIRKITRLGLPYVNAYLDRTQREAPRYFGLFLVFAIGLNLFLYRSVRTLAAFLVTLGVCLALSMGYIGVTGGTFTLVSPMVPMTILVTATSTLVYLHGRFVERPPDRPRDVHQRFALANKFLPCTASIFATGVGFAALAISKIRPIREMGVWVAVGLAITWLVVFTLFPALQWILQTPTHPPRAATDDGFARLAGRISGLSYRFRWPLVAAALSLSALGGAALFGVPGVLAPLPVQVDPVKYIGHEVPLYRDIERSQKLVPGLSITDVWISGRLGSISDPAVLTGLHAFQQALAREPEVGAVIGPTTILCLLRYLGGEGDGWPETAAGREQMAAELESLVSMEPMLQRFVQPRTLAQAHLAVISQAAEEKAYQRLEAAIHRHWEAAVREHPALAPLTLRIVGLGPLHARMAQNLVPTLVESFALTAAVIFTTFLVVFRSGTARLMAMIPSLFAILVMFGVARGVGVLFNVGTILVASTVLGTSENDQIHFFYHYQEGRRDGSVEQSLRHTFLVSGRAILFATLINAGGFLAFAVSDLPPLRQFGSLAALAFVLSMLADFTALPAALWLLSRQRPDRAGAAAP